MPKDTKDNGDIRVRMAPETYQRLKKFKGSKTWDGLFKSWLDHFEGFNRSEDEIKYITNGDWIELNKRIESVESRVEHIGGNKARDIIP